MAERIDIHHDERGSPTRDFPLSFLDTYFVPVDIVLVIGGCLDKERLRESLSKTLSLYPPVYGRFKPPSPATHGGLSLDLYHSIPLFWLSNSTTNFEPSAWKHFIKRIATNKVLKGQAPPLQVTVTYLPRTSQTILGVSFCHVLGDALSLSTLLKTWSNIHARDTALIPPPVTERIRFPYPLQPAASVKVIPQRPPRRSQQFSPTLASKLKAYVPLVHAMVFKTIEYARFHISAQDLNILTQKTRSRLLPATCSTQDAFKAYLLKALNRFVYNGLTAHPRVTRIVTIVDARKARRVPDTYFGNCITAVDTPYMPASKTLGEVALAVREGVTSISMETLAKGDDWIRAIQEVNGLMDLTPAFDQDTLYVNDWTKVSVEEVDFGQRQDMFCQPLEVETLPVRNWCMIYRANNGDRSGEGKGFAYQVQVSVPRGKTAHLVDGIALDARERFEEYFW